MMKNNSIKVGTVRYLYDPFDMTIYEIYVQQIIENMFGEPDEIHAKTRIYIDETGVKDATKPWDNIKTISTYSYLANDLTDKKEAIIAFQTDISKKHAKLEEELKCTQGLMRNLEILKRAINSSEN